MSGDKILYRWADKDGDRLTLHHEVRDGARRHFIEIYNGRLDEQAEVFAPQGEELERFIAALRAASGDEPEAL